MSGALPDIGLIVLFVLAGGVFAAAEIALVSLRPSQLATLAGRGRRGARVSRLASDPNRFLSAVQVGVTLMGFLSAAFGGATIATQVGAALTRLGLAAGIAGTIALVLVTVAVSYVSIVLGELAAKRLALQRAEGFALALAPLVDRIATVLRPVIWFLSKSTDVVVRLLGGDPRAQREEMSDDELRELVSGHRTLAVEARTIVTEVLGAANRQIREVMVPRTEADFLDVGLPLPEAIELCRSLPQSRYPVIRGSADDVVGFVHIRDLFVRDLVDGATSLRVGDVVREVMLLPQSVRLLTALGRMRDEGAHLAVVVDEFGGTAGVVTLEDVLEVLIGDIRGEYEVAEPAVTQTAAGVLEVDALANLDDFADATGVTLPHGPYETVTGFVVARLGRLAVVGDEVDVDGARLAVTSVHGKRADRVRVTRAVSGQSR